MKRQEGGLITPSPNHWWSTVRVGLVLVIQNSTTAQGELTQTLPGPRCENYNYQDLVGVLAGERRKIRSIGVVYCSDALLDV